MVEITEEGTNELDGQPQQTENAGVADEKKGRSTIKFPYGDLKEAQTVAQKIHDDGGSVELDRLAPLLGYNTASGGALSVKLTTAQIFGLIVRDGKRFRLTTLGQRIVSPEISAQAQAEAFLSVELYKKVFEEYRGRALPPDAGLENYMKQVGVSEKQTDKARQAMRRSAEQAGFFEMGKDRLVAPKALNGGKSTPPGQNREGEETPPDPPKSKLHPAVEGMLIALPKNGDFWTADEQSDWIAAFTQVLTFFHQDKTKPKDSL